MQITTTNDQEIEVTLAPQTAGNPPRPAPIDGIPEWEILDGNSTITVAPNGLSAVLRSEDNPGAPPANDTNIKVTADADLGSGVVPIELDIRYTVEPAMAAGFGVTLGEPRQKT